MGKALSGELSCPCDRSCLITCTSSQMFRELFEGSGTNPGDKTLEDKFFEHEVIHLLTFQNVFISFECACITPGNARTIITVTVRTC